MQPYFKRALFIFLVILTSVLQPSCKSRGSEAPNISAKDSLKALVGNQYQHIDQSPMDISYCPVEYPQNKMKGIVSGGPVARVIYSRPHKKGRVIFSNDANSLCQYGKPWRLGANESTEIEFFKPVMVAGKNVSPGRYALYCIPHPDKWELVFSSNIDSWGLHIDESKDLFKIEAPVQQQASVVEDFTIVFQDRHDGADLLMTWDNVKVQVPITFTP